MNGYDMSREEADAENEGMFYRGDDSYSTDRYGVLDSREAYDTLKAVSKELGISAGDYRHFFRHADAEQELFKKIINDYAALHRKEDFRTYGTAQLREIKLDIDAVYRMESGE